MNIFNYKKEYQKAVRNILKNKILKNNFKELSTNISNVIYLTLDNGRILADYTNDLNLYLLTENELYNLYNELESIVINILINNKDYNNFNFNNCKDYIEYLIINNIPLVNLNSCGIEENIIKNEYNYNNITRDFVAGANKIIKTEGIEKLLKTKSGDIINIGIVENYY